MIAALWLYAAVLTDPAAGLAALAATVGGAGGLWLVARLIVNFQADFTNRYAARLIEQDAKIAAGEARIDALEKDLLRCNTERHAQRVVLRQHGIAFDPQEWGL